MPLMTRVFARLRPALWIAVVAALLAGAWWWLRSGIRTAAPETRHAPADSYEGSSGMGADGFGGWPGRTDKGE